MAKTRIGKQEAQLLSYAQMRGTQTLRIGDLVGPLGITSKQERELYSRMARAGMIAGVTRGVYLVPERLPLGGEWSPDEIQVLNVLMRERGGCYQICGPSAFNYYGFDDQVPARVYAYNNRISDDRRIGAVALTLIKVADSRLGDTETVKMFDGETAIYSSRTRTLVDAVYDWSRFNSLPKAYDWIVQELGARRTTPPQLIASTLAFGDKGTSRRIGFLLEREGVGERITRKLRRALPESTATIPWNPAKPKRGTVNRRWGLVVNDEQK